MYSISHDQLQEEEGCVDGQKDHNPRRLRETHVCDWDARCADLALRPRNVYHKMLLCCPRAPMRMQPDSDMLRRLLKGCYCEVEVVRCGRGAGSDKSWVAHKLIASNPPYPPKSCRAENGRQTARRVHTWTGTIPFLGRDMLSKVAQE